MAWYIPDDHDSTEVVDEASVGLIAPKSEVTARHPTDQRRSRISKSVLGIVLMLSNLAWAGACLILWRQVHTARNPAHLRHDGFEADFGTSVSNTRLRLVHNDTKQSILTVTTAPLPYKHATIKFDDLLRYNETSHEVYRQMDPTLPLYFGKPSPAMDTAWAELLQYEYPAITPEEMAENPFLSYDMDKDKHPVTGKYHFALDVFHNLHCLNAVRIELDKDYYGPHNHGHIGRRAEHDHEPHAPQQHQSAWDAAARDHIDHCMNHIRQSLQCRPDLSPAAMHVFADFDGSKYFLGNAEKHTCYDWESVIDWAAARKTEPGYAAPVH